jgi:hypothetical protein
MSILEKLFKRGGTVQATVERTESELGVELARVERVIASGEGDVMAALEERETLTLQIQAAGIARQAREQTAYQARLAARRTKYLAEVQTTLAGVWRTLPELRWHLQGLVMLEQRMDEIADGRSWADCTGLPFGAVRQMSEAIGAALANTRLGAEAYTPGKVSTPDITPMPQPVLRARFQGDRAPPPGFTGTWDYRTGKPFVEGEGPNVTLPKAGT